jgi:hypothetical protein
VLVQQIQREAMMNAVSTGDTSERDYGKKIMKNIGEYMKYKKNSSQLQQKRGWN